MGDISRATVTGLSVIAIVLAVVLLARSNESDAKKQPVPVKTTLAKCRLVCRCQADQPCQMTDCSEDCHPADPELCVEKMICPDGHAWSKTDCSCNAVK